MGAPKMNNEELLLTKKISDYVKDWFDNWFSEFYIDFSRNSKISGKVAIKGKREIEIQFYLKIPAFPVDVSYAMEFFVPDEEETVEFFAQSVIKKLLSLMVKQINSRTAIFHTKDEE